MMRVNAAAYPYLAGLTVVALVALLIWPLAAIPFALASFAIAWFFRDPERTPPDAPGTMVAPADGRVFDVAEDEPNPFEPDGPREMQRISIFLSLINVHINRAPCDGRVVRLQYIPGKFHHAGTPEAVRENERQLIEIESPEFGTVVVVQSSGALVRKIVCNLTPGQMVKRGARFGLIKFGSRTDLYLSPKAAPAVSVGTRTLGGETIMGRLR